MGQPTWTMTTEEVIAKIPFIVAEATQHAAAAADKFLKENLNGNDSYPCGFAWANIYTFTGKKIRGNSKLGKALKANGIEQDYNRTFQIWNPSGIPVQNVDVKEAGARAFANVFTKYGFEAYAGSRLD